MAEGADGFLTPTTASFSQPAAGNPTVAMVEAAYAQLGLAWRYVNLDVAPDDLEAAVRGARVMGFRGFNCSLPHKVAVIDHLDGLGRSAEIVRAVNCVVRRGDDLIGENTDGQGFLRSIRSRREPAGTNVVVFGAGGAARAIAVELALAGVARLTIVNRGTERLNELVELLARRSPGTEVHAIELTDGFTVPAADLVVNATSVGLAPDVGGRLPVVLDELAGTGAVVADVVFNPAETALLRDARSLGLETVDGREMLVEQAVLGVELWTGRTPAAGTMRAALDSVM